MENITVTVTWEGIMDEHYQPDIEARDRFEVIIENYIKRFNSLPLKGHKMNNHFSEVAEIIDIHLMEEDDVHFILGWDYLDNK